MSPLFYIMPYKLNTNNQNKEKQLVYTYIKDIVLCNLL